MSFHGPLKPITVDDDALRAHLESAEVPALLMTVAHLTGDLSVLREDLRAAGWLFAPQGGLSAEQRAAARETAFGALVRYRQAGSVPPPPPDRETLRRISGWAMGGDTEDVLPLLAEEIVLPGQDPRAPRWRARDFAAPAGEAPERPRGPGAVRVSIIGAGMSGLLAGYRLAQAGVPFTIYEKNDDVGGTWLENHYPGCRVDVPSHLYSYPFANRSDWPDHFCTQDQLLEYFQAFAKEYGLYEHIRFNTEVREACWEEESARWRLRLHGPDGERSVRSEVLVSAVGQLNRPELPDIPGRERFAGPAFHSASWDHGVPLAGRRVAVIGTGASAYQFIPEVAKIAGELTVFQRTPPWLRPTPHYHDPVPPSTAWLYEHIPYYAAWHRFWLFAPGLRGVLEGWIVDPDHPPTERAVSAVNDELRATLTRHLQAQLTDAPELLPRVLPRYPVGAKRVLRDNGVWLRTLRRDNVTLVTEKISEITESGVRTADGVLHEADILIYGTGFAASRFLAPMRVTGIGGADLHETWDGDARAYLGLTVPGFPNLFCLYGPNTNLSGQGGSIFYFSECGVTYLLDAVRLLLESGRRSLDVKRDVHDAYNAWVDRANSERAWGWSKVSNWFTNEKGRSAQNWPFTAQEYWRRTRRVDPSDYETPDRPGRSTDPAASSGKR
ncbi:NAD(P)/FAD-dependent oxidoreductase [Streptomyces sp. HU2014]|uniref:Cyclohexanone monooxygenase n=1 Tax=Streptomyces albireticuli TaxID=1940 RepID=A0A1Z2KWC0_9ACTN|nr:MULTISPECIES: NAD(P)/FAD-dependent oxidoreductase [Streptomyces]ARZ66348.1 Cyclohexanone monooxygenase [Streptomyces albireticuli]UQI46573.1 NAD(P)/FAD-dependent oxidoreductase [Streptomyces sp. HU2014]